MKFKNWCLIVVFVLVQQAFSQEGVAIYSDYLNDNYFLVHPSMAGASNCTKIRATARQQWFDSDKAPRLQTLSANGQVGESLGVGAIFFNDRNGNHSQTGAKLAVAKHLRMSSNYMELNRLQLGIAAGAVRSRLDETSFDLLNTQFDPTIGGVKQTDNYFNVDIGASYLLGSMYAHLTYRNLATSKRELYTDYESDNIRKMILNVGYVWGNKNVIQIEPSLMYINTLETKERSIDYNLKAYKPLDLGTVWGGISWRRQVERAEQLETDKGQRQSMITAILGLNVKNYMFAYNYTHLLGDINYSGGFHQITLGIDLFCKPVPFECNCPAINNGR
ncbi:PorP/SprF family type IX secretion system membrane protein [Flavobacterium sp. UBA7682]|uniref:PorP/SprF family type IX secretion system membrane protein n=1 Tax=Flavobacterium sp. UBA7682 TaxID=1946560 RepID=UPI0025BE4DA3|nr:type IX secretion system membrane protein PorP/SprF [Flavobacterium sp. UBA7682]